MNMVFVILPAAAILFVLLVFFEYLRIRRRGPERDCREVLTSVGRDGRIRPRDLLILCFITAAYAAAAFYSLGDNRAPQSFCLFAERGRYATVEFSEPTQISRMTWYAGYCTGDYFLQFSDDGETWTESIVMKQETASVFKWVDAELPAGGVTAKYARLIAGGKLEMGELALYGAEGELIPVSDMTFTPGAYQLFDEQAVIPPEQTFKNSSYFDEIYHARTAYEHIRELKPYEVTHPPLGKIILSMGIRLFGLNPFGWRFMGTLFGVLMLPILYVFLKKVFLRRSIAVCGTLIFAFDFMHFTQTRIATIDTYAVFFILLMYYFMYRFISADRTDPCLPKRKTTLPLFLSGLFFGLGAASKWSVIYGGAGLALLWLLFWIRRGRDLSRAGQGRRFRRELAGNIALCVVFFVLLPGAIYYASYWPYGKANGLDGLSMFLTGDYAKIVWDNQKSMFSYHSTLVSTHPYSAQWYKWILDIRPILYYLRYYGDAGKASIGAFVNPLLCWGGLLAILCTGWRGLIRRDQTALFIFIGYLAQLVPWIPVTRLTFEYHYFPSTVFLTMALCYVFNVLWERGGRRWPAYTFTGASLGLFVLFYPVLSGMTFSAWYSTNILQWFPSWPF
jgi:4-amino-4-deoxy-L-arabinose transferase-like glycosyltransferase